MKIDGLKLYPPGPDTRGWRMDDEKLTYPLYAVLRKHGVKNVCVHKGFPGSFLEPGCHPEDMTRAAADWPDLNFIAFHSAYPFEAELAEQAKKAKVKNIYAEMGLLASVMRLGEGENQEGEGHSPLALLEKLPSPPREAVLPGFSAVGRGWG